MIAVLDFIHIATVRNQSCYNASGVKNPLSAASAILDLTGSAFSKSPVPVILQVGL